MPAAVIVDYDPAWPARAQLLLSEVRSPFASLSEPDHFVYEHIGSTAVPGLAATPFVPAHGARPDSPRGAQGHATAGRSR